MDIGIISLFFSAFAIGLSVYSEYSTRRNMKKIEAFRKEYHEDH